MTPFEAQILGFMERLQKVERNPISLDRIVSQFSISHGYADLVMRSLKRQLLVEQDRKHFRLTTTANEALTDFADHFKYIPFEGKGGIPAASW